MGTLFPSASYLCVASWLFHWYLSFQIPFGSWGGGDAPDVHLDDEVQDSVHVLFVLFPEILGFGDQAEFIVFIRGGRDRGGKPHQEK